MGNKYKSIIKGLALGFACFACGAAFMLGHLWTGAIIAVLSIFGDKICRNKDKCCK